MDIYDESIGEELNEAPYEITGPHSYKHGDSDPKYDTGVKNKPFVVGSFKGDDAATRKRARSKAENSIKNMGEVCIR